MPVGINTYKGLAVPRYGESELLQQTTNDLLTMQHSSANAGNFLVLRDRISTVAGLTFADGSTVTGSDLFKIDGSGSLVAASTVLGDATMAGLRRPVVESTVGQTLTIAQSGTLFVVSSAVGTSLTFDLPVGSGVPGTWYEFWVSSHSEIGDVRVSVSSLVAAKLHGTAVISSASGAASSVVSTFASLTPMLLGDGNFGSRYLRVTALTSLLWAFETNGGYSSASSLGAGMWQAGSTAA